ncbi:uncharacterized protein Z519_10911 [Cladophialophora bantiana CBS 173.52]|uniref:Flavoprotein oxygenase n=1 Tax=Cladophialophora bantiana (strain ATCC 10958 / CBS 173.52 / CDC B-1940 / NIH 8579) TaxID=1442370 RepID=A0A0D2H4X0_CLAB1|nr:uncharacterized protein Z519_10911 [Cladophialophora bantiana CBS 173.52]KIW88343.1 hypothetical protein Z519_10911 [Cladophialophora bantiana CBS 173.52]
MARRSSSIPASVHDGAEVCAVQHSSLLSLRQQPSCSSSPSSLAPPLADISQTHDYNFSGAVYDESTSNSESESLSQPDQGYEDSIANHRVVSGCSSISSFPTTISQSLPSSREQYDGSRTPSKRDSFGFYSYERAAPPRPATTSPRNIREYHSAFRHASSVKALQMKDETMSDTHSVIRHHRRTGSQMSSYSQRSSFSIQTSPTKRSTRSHHTSPLKGGTNLKREFPLILLHCTLLPPNQRFQPSSQENANLRELLPEEYKQRWIALRDRLTDVEINSRGVLIPHPRDDYGLLEERLLESLELEKPRIQHNHYFNAGGSSTDSGFESGSLTDDEADLDGSAHLKCPDCGGHLRPEERNRRWDVKVFAANGLMRAGAWAAAWQEMEKVDVEINVCLPEEICQELEAKLAFVNDSQVETSPLDSGEAIREPEIITSREREVYGEFGRLESETDTINFGKQPVLESEPMQPPPSSGSFEQDAQAQMAGHGRQLTKETRNLLIGVLSFLVLLFALAGRQESKKESPVPLLQFTTRLGEVLTTTVTTTSIAISTATVTASIIAPVPYECSLSERADDLTVVSTESLTELPSATDQPRPPPEPTQRDTSSPDIPLRVELEYGQNDSSLASEQGGLENEPAE